MEDDVFPSSAVAELLENHYVEARLHNDHPTQGEANRDLQMDRIGFIAAPYYLIVDPNTGKAVEEHRLRGVSDGWDVIADKFRSYLERNKSHSE